jgi:hypothetical protein
MSSPKTTNPKGAMHKAKGTRPATRQRTGQLSVPQQILGMSFGGKSVFRTLSQAFESRSGSVWPGCRGMPDGEALDLR